VKKLAKYLRNIEELTTQILKEIEDYKNAYARQELLLSLSKEEIRRDDIDQWIVALKDAEFSQQEIGYGLGRNQSTIARHLTNMEKEDL
jgi:predicted transcriptional regulator